MKHKSTHDIDTNAEVLRGGAAEIGGPRMRTQFRVECYHAGALKWVEEFNNTVVNAGLDDILDKYFKGSAYTASFFVGLFTFAASPGVIAAGDTMSSHAGWTETAGSPEVYDEATRPALTLGTVSSQSVDNSASKASYTILQTDTIDGAFVTTDSTKGGTSGTLYGVGAFTGGPKTVGNGDTLNVTVTLTSAAA